jgi:hypothetical protein
LIGTEAAGSVTWIALSTPWLTKSIRSRQFQLSRFCQSELRLSLAKPIRTTEDETVIVVSSHYTPAMRQKVTEI